MEENKAWYEKVNRIGKLFMVENDPGAYDYNFWVDYFQRTYVDCINICAGGIVAFYPTKVPFHRTSNWMGNGDPFGELVKAARSMNKYVIARIDPHAIHQEAYEAHPEWIAVDGEGNKRRHWANPDLWVTCTLGPFVFSFIAEVVKEITTLYGVDGFHINRFHGSGICYCDNCKKEFMEKYNLEIPRKDQPADPAWKSYNLWYERKLLEIWDHFEAEIQKINPNGHFLPNYFHNFESISAKDASQRVRIINVDYQARNSRTPVWDIGRVAKKMRSTLGDAPLVAGISPGFEDRYRWKDSVRDKTELKMWYMVAIANGMRIAWGKFSAVLYDTRWLKPVEEIFQWHYRNEKYLSSVQSGANVGILWSPSKKVLNEGMSVKEETEDHSLGMYFALLNARIPFEMVNTELLDEEHLDGFKLLILPNISLLSEHQCNEIRKYVQRGGSILATYETSLYDEQGKRRENFGLADVFGVSYQSNKAGPIKNSYLRLEVDPTSGQYHPLLKGLEDAGRIIHGVWQLEVEPVNKFIPSPLTLIPSYPDLPMEDVYPRQPVTDIPQVFLQETGKGRIVYFPWDIDRVFWEVMCLDHGKLISNAVKWAMKDELPVTVSGSGLLDVTVWHQENSMTVHLVNLTNPMAMKGTFHEFIPIGEQKVTIRLPHDKKAAGVLLLVKGEAVDFEAEDGLITVRVKNILDHEVIAVDFVYEKTK